MSENVFDRELPSATISEAAILSTALMERQLPDCDLDAEDFQHPHNRALWVLLASMAENREAIDPATVATRLNDASRAYLAALIDGAVVTDPAFHAVRLRESRARRRAIQLAHDIAERAYDGAQPADLADSLAAAAAELSGAAIQRQRALLPADMHAMTRTFAQTIDSARIPTGIKPLDAVIGGLGRGQVLTILARTSVGKSAIAQNMVAAFLRRGGNGSAVFCSAEMPAVDFWLRQMQIEANIGEGDVIASYRNGLEPAPGFVERARGRLLVIPTAYLRLSDIERTITRAVQRGDIGEPEYVIFDYAKLFAAERQTRSDTERVGEIARGVKVLAKNANVACVLLSQCGRSEKNDGTQPVTLNDARDSGEIEEAADFLLGCWRPGMNKGDPRTMEMAILKGRRCRRATFTTLFEGRTLRLSEPEQPPEEERFKW